MTLLAASDHFAGAPEWTWFILFYFFLAGLAGGTYFLATLLRYWGTPGDEPVARLGFYVPFPATLIGLLLLTLDLKQPLRFWHMLFNTTPEQFGLNFNSRTPMSVGVWALLVASVFAFVAFFDSLVRDGRIRIAPARRLSALLDGTAGLIWNAVGAALYLFIAGYTGVLLAVSNQPTGRWARRSTSPGSSSGSSPWPGCCRASAISPSAVSPSRPKGGRWRPACRSGSLRRGSSSPVCSLCGPR